MSNVDTTANIILRSFDVYYGGKILYSVIRVFFFLLFSVCCLFVVVPTLIFLCASRVFLFSFYCCYFHPMWSSLISSDTKHFLSLLSLLLFICCCSSAAFTSIKFVCNKTFYKLIPIEFHSTSLFRVMILVCTSLLFCHFVFMWLKHELIIGKQSEYLLLENLAIAVCENVSQCSFSYYTRIELLITNKAPLSSSLSLFISIKLSAFQRCFFVFSFLHDWSK